MFFKNITYDYQHKEQFDELVAKWQPSSDVWPFKYSKYALPGLGSLTAFWTTMYLRKMTNMGNVARITTLSIPLYGTVFCGLVHSLFVEFPLIAGREHCSICTSTRSAVIQGMFGSVFPTIISAITIAYSAGHSNLYAFQDKMFSDLSAMKTNGHIILNLFKKRRADRIVVALFVVNVLFGYFIGYMKQESMFKIAKKLHSEGKSFIVDPEHWDPMKGIKL